MASVTFEHVSKRYGDVTAVDDLSLEIADKEFMVLLGPSGCGKTTALRMIAGLEDISGGTISIGNRVVNHVAPKDRDIAMVFQSYALYPHMTVRENLSFGLENIRTPRPEIARRVAAASALLQIDQLLERPELACRQPSAEHAVVDRACRCVGVRLRSHCSMRSQIAAS